MIYTITDTMLERFWSKVNKKGKYPEKDAYEVHPEIRGTRCYVYKTIRVDKGGYCRFVLGRRSLGTIMVHRFAYLLYHGKHSLDGGKWIKGKFYKWQVLHKCDNPLCVREEHLFRGTDIENTKDKCIKGREACNKGERNGQAKLTSEQVVRIRALYATGKYSKVKLGKMFDVTDSLIRNIVFNRSWLHV